MNKPFEFQIGDEVRYYPRQGVTYILQSNPDLDYPLTIQDAGRRLASFTQEGYLIKGDTNPILTLVHRHVPKSKTTKTIEQWANVYPGGVIEEVYDTLQEADNYGTVSRIAVVKLVGTYETEE